MRARSTRLLLALTLLVVSANSQGGIVATDPLEFHIRIRGFQNVRLVGKVSAIGWQGRDTSLSPRRLKSAAPLAGFSTRAPAGEWSEMVLLLDGPVTITAQTETGARVNLRLQVDELVVPLAEPTGGETVALDLALPDWIAAAAAGGLNIQPGDPLHERLVAALQDGALGLPAR